MKREEELESGEWRRKEQEETGRRAGGEGSRDRERIRLKWDDEVFYQMKLMLSRMKRTWN